MPEGSCRIANARSLTFWGLGTRMSPGMAGFITPHTLCSFIHFVRCRVTPTFHTFGKINSHIGSTAWPLGGIHCEVLFVLPALDKGCACRPWVSYIAKSWWEQAILLGRHCPLCFKHCKKCMRGEGDVYSSWQGGSTRCLRARVPLREGDAELTNCKRRLRCGYAVHLRPKNATQVLLGGAYPNPSRFVITIPKLVNFANVSLRTFGTLQGMS